MSFSQEGIYVIIRLDRKARLVLPLEIRDAIGIKAGDKILLSVIAANDGKVTIELAKAPENIKSCAYSRNAGYVEKRRCEK